MLNPAYKTTYLVIWLSLAPNFAHFIQLVMSPGSCFSFAPSNNPSPLCWSEDSSQLCYFSALLATLSPNRNSHHLNSHSKERLFLFINLMLYSQQLRNHRTCSSDKEEWCVSLLSFSVSWIGILKDLGRIGTKFTSREWVFSKFWVICDSWSRHSVSRRKIIVYVREGQTILI